MKEKDKRKIGWWVVVVTIVGIFLWRYFAPRFSGDVPVTGIALGVGNVGVHWYGLIIAFAIITSYFIFIRPNIYRIGATEEKLSNLILLLIVFGIIGARLVYVLQNTQYYFTNPVQILAVWNGGMSIHGALLFGVIIIAVWAKKNKINILKLLDVFAPAVIFSMALGRLGNFYNHELVGVPTSVLWKMYVPSTYRPVEFININFFHPVFLYEMILDLLVLAILLWVSKNKHPKPGIIFLLFVGLYSIVRFIVEFWRYNEVHYFWGLSLAQIASVILIMLSAVGIYFLQKKTPDAINPITPQKSHLRGVNGG